MAGVGLVLGPPTRKAGAKHAERNARLAKKLAAEAHQVAATERRDAREAYDKLRDAFVEAAIEMEGALPKRLRSIAANLLAAESRWANADEVLDARVADLVVAEDAVEKARQS